MKLNTRKLNRVRRHRRIRRKLFGTSDRPRMALWRSNRYLYVQFIDDEQSATIAAVSTLGGEGNTKGVEAARELGRRAGAIAVEKGITQVIVDRGGFKFHGRVKAIVDGAVESGLSISSKAIKQPQGEETK